MIFVQNGVVSEGGSAWAPVGQSVASPLAALNINEVTEHKKQ